MNGKTRKTVQALTLVGLGAALAGSGLALRQPAAPRIQVCSGQVLVASRPGGPARAGRSGEVFTPGAVLGIAAHEGGATLIDSRNNSLTISGKSELAFAGTTADGPVWWLNFGSLFVRGGDGAGGLAVDSPLANVRGHGVFRVFLPAPATGLAADTPRELQLAVAVGSVRLSTAGTPSDHEVIPAGTKARIRSDLRRITLEEKPLSADEWRQLTGARPENCDPGTPADKIPAGVWVRREPGRHGPSPGSRSSFSMFYSPELAGGVLPAEDGGHDEEWSYDARADRWRRLRSDERRQQVGRPAATEAPSAPAGASDASVASAKEQNIHLLYGRVGEAVETWLYQPEAAAWTRLDPPASPPPRTGCALYFDDATGLFVMYGGQSHGRSWDDVWVFRAPGREGTPEGESSARTSP